MVVYHLRREERKRAALLRACRGRATQRAMGPRPLRISLVTPSLDQARFLERTIESVLSQRGPFELEYLVCDGGSTDGSVEILRRYQGRLLARVEPDAGQADAVNKGLRAATGDVLGWLNSDDVLRPGALARVAEVFLARPDVQWLHGSCDIIDAEDRPIRAAIRRYKDWRCRHHSFRSLLLENYISQMTVFWRRSAMERAGLLDATLHYTFDYDLWLRLSRLGPPAFIPETLAAFRWYPQSKSGARYRRQFEEDYRVFLRHAPRDPWLRLAKRLRTAHIVATYGVMSALRLGG